MSASSPVDELPPAHRLALAYAPAHARERWSALLELDRMLRRTCGQAREPLLAQLRLAWWRERLGEAPEAWPAGEPTLARLRCWGEHARELIALVDGWEAMLEDPPQPGMLAEGRGAAMAALAEALGVREAAERARLAGRQWSFAESDNLIENEPILLPRSLRPLHILQVYPQYHQRGVVGFLKLIKAGLFGR